MANNSEEESLDSKASDQPDSPGEIIPALVRN